MKNLLKKGELLFAQGDIENAKHCFLKILRKESSNPEALNNLGVIYFFRNNLNKAEDYFLKAMATKEDYTGALLNLAKLYQDKAQWEKAADFITRYISLGHQDCDSLNQLGIICMEMGQIKEAQGALQKSLALNPDQGNVAGLIRQLENVNISSDQVTDAGLQEEREEKSAAATVVSRAEAHPTSSKPTISIGLAVYSGGTMLSDAIGSILRQDYTDIELLVSDHGSDPLTKEICLSYSQSDHRVRYIHTRENVTHISYHNMLRLADLAAAPYFMWSSYDDIFDRSYLSKCLDTIRQDPTIALVYPRSKVIDRDSNYIGIGNDHLKADQTDPLERYRHVIFELGMCNAFFGLQRTDLVRKTRAFLCRQYVGHDNLYLAEMSLMGRIVQIDDILFTRRLTRNYQREMDAWNADVMRSHCPETLEEGITLPYCRFAYSHCELINYSRLNRSTKEQLTRETVKCFRTRWHKQMEYEIKRTMALVENGRFFQTWDKRVYAESPQPGKSLLEGFHIADLLKHLQEAIFIYPDWSRLREVYNLCLQEMDSRILEQRF